MSDPLSHEVIEAEVVPADEVKRRPTRMRGATRDHSEARVVEMVDLLCAGLSIEKVALRVGVEYEEVAALCRYPQVQEAIKNGGFVRLLEQQEEVHNLTMDAFDELAEMLGKEMPDKLKLEVIDRVLRIRTAVMPAPKEPAAESTTITVGVAAGAGSGESASEPWQSRVNALAQLAIERKTG